MNKHTVRRASAVLTLGGLLLLSSPASVFAATTNNNSTTNNANTLKISPVRSDITVTAGTNGVVKAVITNLTAAPITVHPIENDFVAGDESGTPSIILDENSYAPTHSLKRFMTPISDFTVPAKGSKEVSVTIAVPKTAQAGGYYGAIRFAPASPSGSKSVNLNASVASLILMTVPGPTTEKLLMTNFDVQQNGETGSNFRTPENLSVMLRFKNEGNIQEGPYGQVYVKKGDKIVYTYNFNQQQPREVVLPDSARKWDVPLKNLGKFGKYTVGGTFSYGSKGQAIEIEKTIWIVPTTYIIGAIIAIVALVLLIVGFIMFLKSYKKRVLRGSRGGRGGYRHR